MVMCSVRTQTQTTRSRESTRRRRRGNVIIHAPVIVGVTEGVVLPLLLLVPVLLRVAVCVCVPVQDGVRVEEGEGL